MDIAKMQMRVAFEQIVKECPSCMVTVEDMETICVSCAEKMRKKGFKSVRASAVLDALKYRERVAAKWETLPKGWTKESLERFWKSLTGDVKHKVSKCIRKIEESDSGITDAGAFCAALCDRLEGKKWRSER